MILVMDPPQCSKNDIGSSVSDAQTIEITFLHSSLVHVDALRAANFMNQMVDADSPGNASIHSAFAAMALAVSAKRTLTCKFRIGFKVDATRMKIVHTELNMDGQSETKTKAIYIVAPELQENATNNCQHLEL